MQLPTDLPDRSLTPLVLRSAERVLRYYHPRVRTGRDVAGLLGIDPTSWSKLKSGKRPITARLEVQVRTLMDSAYLAALNAPVAFGDRLEEELSRVGAGVQLNEDQRLVLLFAVVRRILDPAAMMANSGVYERALAAVREVLEMPVDGNLESQRARAGREARAILQAAIAKARS